MPVRADKVWMTQRRGDVSRVRLAAGNLILDLDEARMEHAPVKRAEVELANQYRLVHALRQFEIIQCVPVEIVADHVTILRPDLDSRLG